MTKKLIAMAFAALMSLGMVACEGGTVEDDGLGTTDDTLQDDGVGTDDGLGTDEGLDDGTTDDDL